MTVDASNIQSRLAPLNLSRKQPEKIVKLEGDASTRVYYRVSYQDGSTAILIAYPHPGLNEERTFIETQRFLEALLLPVPKVFAQYPEHGLVILEDLGDDLLERVVAGSSPYQLRDLYLLALDTLIRMRRATSGLSAGCEAFQLAFDEKKLMQEMAFFMTHFVRGYCGARPSRAASSMLEQLFVKICLVLAAQPRIFTHRDFHSRNLIFHKDRLVMIDFQDARMGPAQYDLASLLRDSYVSLPDELVDELLDYYTHQFPDMDDQESAQFRYIFDLMSLQRNIKALGTFGYQASVKGSARYLSSIPRTATYISANIERYPEFSPYVFVVEDFITGPGLTAHNFNVIYK